MRNTAKITATVLAAGALTLGLTACTAPDTTTGTKPTTSRSATPTADPYVAPAASVVATLPEARYDAVIGGLLPFYDAKIPKTAPPIST